MKVTFKKVYDGNQWLYESDNGETLSVVCHEYSYGGDSGNFETMCSWLKDVQGYLTFGQVQQKINTIYKRERKFHENNKEG